VAAVKHQRGLVLLPVTLVLAIVGTLAYAMTRDGAMNASAVDTQYEIDQARYLAEAGVNLIRWRNEQSKCGNGAGFTGPVSAVEGGILTASGITYKKSNLGMTVTATTARGTVNTIVISEKQGVPVYDFSQKTEISISAQNGSDTFIRKSPSAVPANLPYLETTEGNAHGLIKFDLSSVPPTALIGEATLRLYLGTVQSTQPGTLDIHRLLRAWPLMMNWTSGWTDAGGDFTPQASATIANVLAPALTYTARIDGLVQVLTSQPAINFGLLLKPTGLITARFNSFEAATNQPQLFLRYYPLCK
jgi:hypothetical protein